MSWPLSSSRIRRTFRTIGERLHGGYRKRSAFTLMRALGIPTPATGILVDTSSPLPPGDRLAVVSRRLVYLRESRVTVPFSSTDATVTRGESGAPPERAGSAEPLAQVDVTPLQREDAP